MEEAGFPGRILSKAEVCHTSFGAYECNRDLPRLYSETRNLYGAVCSRCCEAAYFERSGQAPLPWKMWMKFSNPGHLVECKRSALRYSSILICQLSQQYSKRRYELAFHFINRTKSKALDNTAA